MSEIDHKNKLLIQASDKIKSLETKLQIATEALEFYGDTTNWFDVVDFGLLEKARLNDEAGYTRAKEALEKIKKETP